MQSGFALKLRFGLAPERSPGILVGQRRFCVHCRPRCRAPWEGWGSREQPRTSVSTRFELLPDVQPGRIPEGLAWSLWFQQGIETVGREEGKMCRQEGPWVADESCTGASPCSLCYVPRSEWFLACCQVDEIPQHFSGCHRSALDMEARTLRSCPW